MFTKFKEYLNTCKTEVDSQIKFISALKTDEQIKGINEKINLCLNAKIKVLEDLSLKNASLSKELENTNNLHYTKNNLLGYGGSALTGALAVKAFNKFWFK